VKLEVLGHSKAERKRFLDVAFALYRDDPNWVPPLRLDLMAQLDPEKNPFFEHADVRHWVAVKDGRDVGRIAGIVNRRHQEIHDERAAHFGFFEAADAETAAALLDAATEFARATGCDRILGPASYSANDPSFGLLIEGFDRPPVILMSYNPPIYMEWIEAAGFTKAKDLVALDAYQPDAHVERIQRIAKRIQRRGGYRLRELDMRRFDEEVELIQELYNAAWEKNWGFVPLTPAELKKLAHDLKPVIDPRLVLFAETDDGTPVGFCFLLRDLNRLFIKFRNGKLFPFGLFRLLWARRRIDSGRLITLGVTPEHRGTGLDALLVHGITQKGAEVNLLDCECSWILEDNKSMIAPIEAIGGKIAKRYRVYEKLVHAAKGPTVTPS